MGLKRSADGGRVIREESFEKRHKPTEAEERAMYEKGEAEHKVILDAHRAAGLIATQALKQVVEACRPGVNTSEICFLGDEMVKDLLRQRYPTRAHKMPNATSVAAIAAKYSTKHLGPDRERVTAKEMAPDDLGLGLGHPTTIAINNQCGRNSPLPGDAMDRQLRPGDLAKIEVSVHVDGCVAAVAHSFIVGGAVPLPRQVEAMLAAKTGALAAIAHMRPGISSLDVTQYVEKAALMHKCHAVDGTLTRAISSEMVDGTLYKMIQHRHAQIVNDNRVEPPECFVEEGDVWVVDMVMSTGDGTARMRSFRETTMFRRLGEHKWIHLLKLRYARDLLNKVVALHPLMPFHRRDFLSVEDTAGIAECIKRQLLLPYPVLYEKQGEYVGHCKLTVIIGPEGAEIIAAPPEQDLIAPPQETVRGE